MTSELSFLELYYALNRCLWNRTILHQSKDCDPLERQLHILAKHLNIQNEQVDAQSNRVIHYALIDSHPDVLSLKKYLSNHSNYKVDGQLDTDKMSTDFLLLMALRDRRAKKLEYDSYATMILDLEGIKLDDLRITLNKHLESEIDHAKKLITKYDMHLDKWYSRLRQIECGQAINHIKLLDQFMQYFPEASENLVIERHVSNRAGFAIEFEPNVIHINVENVNTLFDMSVFFHQLGHGLSHALDTSVGMKRIYSNFYEELTGVLVERFLGKMLGEKSEKCLNDIRRLQYVRFNIEALYELDLWFSTTSPEDLFRAHYEKIIGNLDEAPISTVQALRLSEPLYMYNYILADRAAKKIIDEGPDTLKGLASHLVNEVFKQGELTKWVKIALE